MKPGKEEEEEEVNLMKAGTNSTGTATHVIDTMASDSGDKGGKKRRKKKKVKKEKGEKSSEKRPKNSKNRKTPKSPKTPNRSAEEEAERMRSSNPCVGDFILKTMLERDPRKRRIKPALDRMLESVALETSSDDSDFDPGDRLKGRKSTDSEMSESDAPQDPDPDVSSDDECEEKGKKSRHLGLSSLFRDDSLAESSSQDNSAFSNRRDPSVSSPFSNRRDPSVSSPFSNRRDPSVSRDESGVPRSGPGTIDRVKVLSIMVCAVCCGDISYDSDEIIECDSCGISVHENCYGVTGSDSEGEEEGEDLTGGSEGRPVDLTLGNASSSPSKSQKTPSKGTSPTTKVPTPKTAKTPTPSKGTPPNKTPPKGTPPNKTTPSKGTPGKVLAPNILLAPKEASDAVSSASSASTEPWFCDPCRSGLDPSCEGCLICELCPNPGGIFKMTVTGRWVHVVCALYTPGVAFLDTNRLDGMTLFELPPDRWGSKLCSLCPDDRLARTGVTICCDAGLCKTNFHVTCAQSEGLLLEAQSLTETEMVDPFYAHCSIHSARDRVLVRKKKTNFHALLAKVRLIRSELRSATAHKCDTVNGDSATAHKCDTVSGDSATVQMSNPLNGAHVGRMNERSWKKLDHARARWCKRRAEYATRYWRPQVKVPRSLATSTLAVQTLIKKTALFGASLVHDIHVFQEEARRKPDQGQLLIKQSLQRMAPHSLSTHSVFDLKPRKKTASFPDFSPEFVSYYLDRESRICEMGSRLSFLQSENERLKREEMETRTEMELGMKECEGLRGICLRNRERTRNIWTLLNRMSSNHPMIVSPTSTPTKITLCTRKYYPTVLDSPLKPSTPLKPSSLPVRSKAAFKSYPVHVSSDGNPSFPLSPPLGQSPFGQSGVGVSGVGVSSSLLSNHNQSMQKPAVLKTCGKCCSTNDQHLLALCDKCHLFIHLHCLDPPLTRMPKKTRFGGWQCSDCTEKQVEMEAEEIANGTLDRQIFGASKSMERQIFEASKSMERQSMDGERESSMDGEREKRMDGERETVTGKRRLRKIPSKFAPDTAGVSSGYKKYPSLPTGGDTLPTGGHTLPSDGFKLTPSGKKRGRPLGCKTGMGMKRKKYTAKKTKISGVDPCHLIQSSGPVTDQGGSTQGGSDQGGSGSTVGVLVSEKTGEVSTSTEVSNPTVGESELKKPKEEGEKKPKEEGEKKPKEEGEKKPKEEGEKKPKEEGEKKPKEERERHRKEEVEKECCVCSLSSPLKTLVQCDNCFLFYHFSCLLPPLKKNPKQRGYDWFCTDCDSSEDDGEEDEGGENGGDSSGSADSESDSSSGSGSDSGSSSDSGSDSEGEE